MPANQSYRNASGQLTFEMSDVPADRYAAVRDAISAEFGLAPHNPPVTNGCDIIFQDFRLGEQIVGLEWDHWTSFTIVAQTPASEPLVQKIAAWVLRSRRAHTQESDA
ncbi:MAG: hypothetical protein HY290_12575 [Planctomycetia bacterium]|nr:hypothetical protein [Planctomycetia bacterium]